MGIPGTNPKHSIYNINCTIGVSQVVYCGWQALQLDHEIIEALRARADEYGEVHIEKPKTGFPGMVGDLVKFKDHSPLFAFIAEIKRVDNDGRLMVLLDKMFGASREISVAASDVGQIIHRDKRPRPFEPTRGEAPLLSNGGSLVLRGGDNGL